VEDTKGGITLKWAVVTELWECVCVELVLALLNFQFLAPEEWLNYLLVLAI